MAADPRSTDPKSADPRSAVLHVTVQTPEMSVLSQDAYSVTAPGTLGYMGILRGHAALISSMVPGKLTVKDLNHKPTVYAVGAGFIEVSHNQVSILADSLVPATAIDEAEAGAARDAAQARLAQSGLTPAQRKEAEEQLAEAKNLVAVRRNPGPSV